MFGMKKYLFVLSTAVLSAILCYAAFSCTRAEAKGIITRCDFTCDGSVDHKDCLWLLRANLNDDYYVTPQNKDVDADGEDTTDDVVYLLKYTQRPENYPLSEATRFWFNTSSSELTYTQEVVCDGFSNSYDSFFSHSAPTCCIMPGLNQNFVPQGVDYWSDADCFLISGYFNPTDTAPYKYSVLFAVEAGTGKFVGEWKIMNPDGTPHSGHDGGVAITGTDVYLSVAYTLHRISLADLKATGGVGEIKIAEQITVPTKASFANGSNGVLWVGEFSLNGNASYTISGHEYGSNYAWCVGYKIQADGSLEDTPSYVLSIPEKIQGFTVLPNGRVFMTSSWGRTTNSTLYITNSNPLDAAPASSVTINGKSVPLYTLGSMTTVSALPMAEGCTAVGSNVYMIFESGAYYYRDYTSNKAKDPTDKVWIYSVY